MLNPILSTVTSASRQYKPCKANGIGTEHPIPFDNPLNSPHQAPFDQGELRFVPRRLLFRTGLDFAECPLPAEAAKVDDPDRTPDEC